MKKILSLLLVLLLAISMLPISASAATVTKDEVTRAIAIVFDNSGSMYQGNENSRKAWCRATYAMEAFANMMNANDVMQIYPMHPITIGKSGSTYYTMENPLTVTQENASTIREIFTPDPQGTPIVTIPAAFEGLKQVSADEKWLIVLTDGTTFDKSITYPYGTFEHNTPEKLGEELSKCREEVNVMYLGIGPAAEPTNVTGSYKYISEIATDSATVLNKLSSMCNTIFGRQTLQGNQNSFEFDVSMSKLILFVQGDSISNVNFGGLKPVDTAELKHAVGGCNGRSPEDDTTLQGVMLTYEDVDAGKLDLSFDNTATSVVCYYEPNVDLYVELLDEAGNVVDPNGELVSGKYSIRYCMVDKYGKETSSSLLGQTQYKIEYTLNGEKHEVPATTGGTIDLEIPPEGKLDADFRVTYLDGYTIHHTSAELGWPSGGLHFAAPAAGNLTITLSGGQSDYQLSSLPQGETFKLSFAYDGVALTEDQLSRLEQMSVTLEGGDGVEGMKNVTAELKQNGGYYVQIGYGGSAVETQCGAYTMKVSGIYRNEDDKLTNTAVATANFTVTDDSRQLAMEVVASQGYYQISEIGSGSPIVVKLLYSGEKLSEEELKAFEPTLSDLQSHIIKEMDVEQSAYIYRFDPENPPAEGDYTINISVSGVNEVGRPQKQSEDVDVSFGLLPMWLKILIPILIFLIILLIIWFIMNQPRLPKNLYVKGMDFSVDGDPINVTKTPKFTGAGKKKGTIVIASPKAGNDPMADQAMTLTVRAVSPRRTKSKNRKALVTAATVARPNNVIYWRLKSTAYVPDPEKAGSFLNATNGKPGFKPIEIGNGSEVEIQAETDSSSVIFKCKLGFK